MTPAGAERLEMRADFAGLIQLLARNLYSEPDAFIRELVQNAHDGIRRRQHIQPDLVGRIDFVIDSANRTITISDNGIGMDRQDIRDFLCVVGASGTGTAGRLLDGERGQETAQSLIGQFGVGTLAAFVVADRVLVHTRKVDSADGWMWENRGNTECLLRRCPRSEPGTSVTLHVAAGSVLALERERVRRAIRRYCDFVSVPIHLDGMGPVNSVNAPWHRTWPDEHAKLEAYRAFAVRHFQEPPLLIVPVEMDGTVSARGLLHIGGGRIPDVNATGLVDIYVRRMFIRARDPELLPPWAKFARGIIDSPDLVPTAARDNVLRRDEACLALTRELGALLMRALEEMARTNPVGFGNLCAKHREHLTALAARARPFLASVRDQLLFETNRGLLPLPACVDRSEQPTLHYLPADADARSCYALADARGIVVVRTVHAQEEDLLVDYVQSRDQELRLLRLDVSRDTPLLRSATSPREQVRRLERFAAAALRNAGLMGSAVSVRCFHPSSRPAVLLVSAQAAANLRLSQLVERRWLADSLRDFAREVLLAERDVRGLHLVLNEEHPVVRRLLAETRAQPELADTVRVLFLSACLYAPDVPAQEVADVCFDPLLRILDRGLVPPAVEQIAHSSGPAVHVTCD